MSLDNKLMLEISRYSRSLAAGMLSKRARMSFRAAVAYVAKEMIKKRHISRRGGMMGV